jgi:SAM-dependent methyltransferase
MTTTQSPPAEAGPLAQPPAAIDQHVLQSFAQHVGQQATAAANAALVALGDRLGLWSELASAGPVTAAGLASRTGLSERLLCEWLSSQAANGFIWYDPERDEFWLNPEAALVLADDDSPASMIAAFQGVADLGALLPALEEAFRTGTGIAWHDHENTFFDVQAQFSRPLQRQFLVDGWLGAVPGLADRLAAGASVADVGCGYGNSTIMLAQAFPTSCFTGFDFHDHSVARARIAARAQGVTDRVHFEVADARSFPGGGYDLVLFVDSLHDMGDPVAAARHARSALAPDGVMVTLDPAALDTLADNLGQNPMAGLMYAVSTFLCTPTALAQHGPAALGAMAGEAAMRGVLTEAGFTQVERVGEDLPMNMVLVARP